MEARICLLSGNVSLSTEDLDSILAGSIGKRGRKKGRNQNHRAKVPFPESGVTSLPPLLGAKSHGSLETMPSFEESLQKSLPASRVIRRTTNTKHESSQDKPVVLDYNCFTTSFRKETKALSKREDTALYEENSMKRRVSREIRCMASQLPRDILLNHVRFRHVAVRQSLERLAKILNNGLLDMLEVYFQRWVSLHGQKKESIIKANMERFLRMGAAHTIARIFGRFLKAQHLRSLQGPFQTLKEIALEAKLQKLAISLQSLWRRRLAMWVFRQRRRIARKERRQKAALCIQTNARRIFFGTRQLRQKRQDRASAILQNSVRIKLARQRAYEKKSHSASIIIQKRGRAFLTMKYHRSLLAKKKIFIDWFVGAALKKSSASVISKRKAASKIQTQFRIFRTEKIKAHSRMTSHIASKCHPEYLRSSHSSFLCNPLQAQKDFADSAQHCQGHLQQPQRSSSVSSAEI